METIKQAIKYGIVGLGNTLITLVVISVMMKLFGFSAVVSNVVGYGAGLVNSFIWNRQWTFKSDASWFGSAVRFGMTWLICYLLQLWLLVWLESNFAVDPLINQMIAMVFFTMLNFLANKFYTFRNTGK